MKRNRLIIDVIKFTIPVLLALFVQALYGAVDLWAVGTFATTDDVSAVAIGSEFMQIITQLVVGLTMGVTVLLASNYAQKSEENCQAVVKASFELFFILGVVLTLLIALFAREGALLMNSPLEALEQTTAYIRVCGLGSLGIVFFNLLGSIFRAVGDSKTPFIFVCITCVINIIGDYVLTRFFALGTLGVAISTTVSQIISVILSLAYMSVKGIGFKVDLFKKNGSRAFVAPMVKIGFPVALQGSVTEASYAIVISFANTLGVLASAGVGVASKVIMFVYLVPTAFVQVISVFTSESVGQGDFRRAKQSLYSGLIWAGLFGFIAAFALFFYGDLISLIFTKDEAVIDISWEYLKVCSIECLVLSFVYSILGFFNGLSRTRFVMIQGLLAIFLVKLPYAYVATFVVEPKVYNIALADALSGIFQLILCLIYLFIIRKSYSFKSRSS